MDLGIRGKIALVTASGRGLGRSIAQLLSEEGARLVINARTQADLSDLLESLHDQDNHFSFCGDLTEAQTPKKLIDFLQANDAVPDIVVHNLGGNLKITDPLCGVRDWHSVMRVNLEIPIEINQWVIPIMQSKKWGRICHISSIAGLENQGPPSYCAAKAALVAYTRSLGRYVSKEGIAMNAVLPGAVLTQGGYWDDAVRERPEHVEKYLKERMAIQRFGKPEEISSFVAFLCSQHASFCAGSSFVVDGGQGRIFYAQD
jgi:NAD(P)-dependent dehydrogenase (short-subunit alcohol dehydrogenase family)